MENMKQCSKCNETKSFSEFSKHKGKKYDLESHCKKCISKQNQLKYSTDFIYRETEKLRVRDYKRKNHEKIYETHKCEICSGKYSLHGKSRHLQSLKHMNALKKL